MPGKRLTAALLSLCLLLTPWAMAEGFTTDAARIDEAAKSVLRVVTYDSGGAQLAVGSGFLAWDGSTLVTCARLLEGADRAEAELDGATLPVSGALAADRERDVALLALASPAPAEPLPLAPDAALRRGDGVVAIGAPQEQRPAVSLGVVSREFARDGARWIETEGPIGAGGSGCAVLDDGGRVIGVTTAGAEGQNLNLAVHICEAELLRAKAEGEPVPIGVLFPAEAPEEALYEEPEEVEDPVTGVFDWITDMAGDAVEDGEGAASGLEFGDGVETEGDGETLRVRFEVRNAGDRDIAGFWLLIYGTDEAGAAIYGHDDGGWWTEATLAPGETGWTEPVELPDDERITALHTLALAVAYADGGEWELDTSDPAEAAARGLVADWDIE